MKETKITDKRCTTTPETVRFDSIDVHKRFESGGNIFLKIQQINVHWRSYNAVDEYNKRCFWFDSGDDITPLCDLKLNADTTPLQLDDIEMGEYFEQTCNDKVKCCIKVIRGQWVDLDSGVTHTGHYSGWELKRVEVEIHIVG